MELLPMIQVLPLNIQQEVTRGMPANQASRFQPRLSALLQPHDKIQFPRKDNGPDLDTMQAGVATAD
jgi:hypothetical protein